MRRKLKALLAASTLAMSAVTPSQAFILGGIVYDPTNHTQNLLTAARTLQMINNQIRQLANEAQMIINQAENLKNLPLTVAADLQTTLAEIDALVTSAKGIAFTVTQTDAAFAAFYPQGYASYTNAEMSIHAQARWQAARFAMEDALRIQAKIAEIAKADSAILDILVSESQSAAGNLQVAQAGNQLTALSAKQTLQMQQLLAAQYRAQTLDDANKLMAKEAGRERMSRFVGDGVIYTP